MSDFEKLYAEFNEKGNSAKTAEEELGKTQQQVADLEAKLDPAKTEAEQARKQLTDAIRAQIKKRKAELTEASKAVAAKDYLKAKNLLTSTEKPTDAKVANELVKFFDKDDYYLVFEDGSMMMVNHKGERAGLVGVTALAGAVYHLLGKKEKADAFFAGIEKHVQLEEGQYPFSVAYKDDGTVYAPAKSSDFVNASVALAYALRGDKEKAEEIETVLKEKYSLPETAGEHLVVPDNSENPKTVTNAMRAACLSLIGKDARPVMAAIEEKIGKDSGHYKDLFLSSSEKSAYADRMPNLAMAVAFKLAGNSHSAEKLWAAVEENIGFEYDGRTDYDYNALRSSKAMSIIADLIINKGVLECQK
jgi:hypothetical protein